MSFVDVNFVLAFFFVSCIIGITSTVCGHVEHSHYRLADVTHTRHFELALRSCTNKPQWYHDGMLLSAYNFNGYTWQRRDLTWAIVRESDRVDTARVVDAATNAFAKWSAVTPFRFTPIVLVEGRRPDIGIALVHFERSMGLSDTLFPEELRVLDDEGVIIVLNDIIKWTAEPDTPGWRNLDFALIYEVTRCLGLSTTSVLGSVMNVYGQGFMIDGDCNLGPDDIAGIRNLYQFDVPERATHGLANGHRPPHLPH